MEPYTIDGRKVVGTLSTTVCRHVAKKYAKFGVGRFAVSAVLGKEGRKAFYGLVSALGLQPA